MKNKYIEIEIGAFKVNQRESDQYIDMSLLLDEMDLKGDNGSSKFDQYLNKPATREFIIYLESTGEVAIKAEAGRAFIHRFLFMDFVFYLDPALERESIRSFTAEFIK